MRTHWASNPKLLDIEQVRVVNLEGCAYLDTIAEPVMRTQKGDILFTSEVERIFEGSNSVLLVDDLSGRTLLIENRIYGNDA